MSKCSPAPARTAPTLAAAKKLSGPASTAPGSTLPQAPPPLMPMYQPVQEGAGGAGGALTGISAAKTLPVKTTKAAAKNVVFMTCLAPAREGQISKLSAGRLWLGS